MKINYEVDLVKSGLKCETEEIRHAEILQGALYIV